eukprot:3327609-Karenia_brevis.AAC.1
MASRSLQKEVQGLHRDPQSQEPSRRTFYGSATQWKLAEVAEDFENGATGQEDSCKGFKEVSCFKEEGAVNVGGGSGGALPWAALVSGEELGAGSSSSLAKEEQGKRLL